MVVEFTALPWRCTGALVGTTVGQSYQTNSYQCMYCKLMQHVSSFPLPSSAVLTVTVSENRPAPTCVAATMEHLYS